MLIMRVVFDGSRLEVECGLEFSQRENQLRRVRGIMCYPRGKPYSCQFAPLHHSTNLEIHRLKKKRAST